MKFGLFFLLEKFEGVSDGAVYRNSLEQVQLAEELAMPIWTTPDEGHLSDISAVNEWASRFGVSDWFRWVRLQ